MGCFSRETFPFKHLYKPSKIFLRSSDLILQQNDTSYIYSSKIYKGIPADIIFENPLVLKNSNDTLLNELNRENVELKLSLSSDKKFSLQVFNKPPLITNYTAYYSGIYGINENKDLVFTQMGSAHFGEGINVNEGPLLNNITESEKYEFRGGILKITNRTANYYYEFSK